MKKQFVSPEFYADHNMLLNAIDDLHSNGLIIDRDQYEEGEILSIQVQDTEANRKKLAPLITDFEGYATYMRETFQPTAETSIDLVGLVAIHEEHFDRANRVVWNKETGKYTLMEQLWQEI